MDKMYVSDMNYYPGEKNLPAGTVFTAAQWEDAGGSPEDLEVHLKKGYIKEAVQTVPEDVAKKEEEKPEASKKAPEGMWNFEIDNLTNLSLEVLNTIAKQRADEFGVDFSKHEDKDALILLMCSQGK